MQLLQLAVFSTTNCSNSSTLRAATTTSAHSLAISTNTDNVGNSGGSWPGNRVCAPHFIVDFRAFARKWMQSFIFLADFCAFARKSTKIRQKLVNLVSFITIGIVREWLQILISQKTVWSRRLKIYVRFLLPHAEYPKWMHSRKWPNGVTYRSFC